MALNTIAETMYNVFIHSSIKTRIETLQFLSVLYSGTSFLYIVPLKQGLKLNFRHMSILGRDVFIHSSIKTRIETAGSRNSICIGERFYT